MYRVSSDPVTERPPVELVYQATDLEAQRRAGFLLLQLGAVPVVGFALVAHYVTFLVGVVAFALLATGMFVWWRRRPHGDGAVLSVEGGMLVVVARRSGKELLRVPVRDVHDVTMDKRTIQRVQEGGSAVPAVRFAETTVGPELEKARLVIVTPSGRLRLSDEYLAYIHTTEWLGKIRVFLRQHGWVPDDEEAGAP